MDIHLKPRSLRIAMIIHGYYPRVGGAERQLGSIAPLLQSMGVDVHIVTRRFPSLLPFEYVQGIPVHRSHATGPKALASFSFTLSTLRLLKRLNPDVIHAHSLLSPATTAVAAKRIFGTPVVITTHGGGKLGDVERLKKRILGAQRIKTFCHNVDRFLTISREIDEQLAEIGVPASKRLFLPNGIDINRFAICAPVEKQIKRKALGLPAGPIVIFTGRLVPGKRLDWLLNVWKIIHAARNDAFLLILGTGPQESSLKAIGAPGVLFLGNVDDVVPFLQAADIFVLPSISEGLPVALLEAMSVGLCCVSTAVGGAIDAIEHGVNGLLISPDNTDELQGAIFSSMNNTVERERMGQKAREKISQQYSLAVVSRRLHSLYLQLNKRNFERCSPSPSGPFENVRL